MQTLFNQIKNMGKMATSKEKQKEFNDKMNSITSRYQKIYKFEINKNSAKHSTWNNEADAFKHAFGSALMVFEFGDFGSFIGGINHEHKTFNNPENEWNMDSWNNHQGRIIADEIKKEYGEKKFKSLSKEKQEDIIAQKVMVKMKNEDLITHPDDKRKYNNLFERNLYNHKKQKDEKEIKTPKGASRNFKTNLKESYKEDDAFIIGFDTGAFTDEGIKKVKLQEKMWTDKFDICDPNKDDGHWITLPNGKHLFIKN